MSMARNESRAIRELGSQGHDRVRKIIAAGPRLQSHVTCKHNRVRAFAFRCHNCATYGLNRMLKIDSNGKFAWKPERHTRRCDSDNCDFDSLNLLKDKWLNFRERMLRI